MNGVSRVYEPILIKIVNFYLCSVGYERQMMLAENKSGLKLICRVVRSLYSYYLLLNSHHTEYVI